MSDSNEIPAIAETADGSCSTKCSSCCPGVLKAVLLTPIVLILGGLAALAMFPDLADYGYPLIGKPSAIGFTGESACSAKGCSGSRSVMPISAESCSAELAASPAFNCCEDSPLCPSSSETAAPAVDTGLTASNENPADATSAANILEVETSSN